MTGIRTPMPQFEKYLPTFVYALMICKILDNVDFDFKESKQKYNDLSNESRQ